MYRRTKTVFRNKTFFYESGVIIASTKQKSVRLATGKFIMLDSLVVYVCRTLIPINAEFFSIHNSINKPSSFSFSQQLKSTLGGGYLVYQALNCLVALAMLIILFYMVSFYKLSKVKS